MKSKSTVNNKSSIRNSQIKLNLNSLRSKSNSTSRIETPRNNSRKISSEIEMKTKFELTLDTLD